jgi:hypothetical protein
MKAIAILAVCLSLCGYSSPGGQRTLAIFSALCGGASQGIGSYQTQQIQKTQFQQQQQINNLQHP